MAKKAERGERKRRREARCQKELLPHWGKERREGK